MKMKFKRFLSGVMAVATLASVIVQPVAVSASELEPEEIPFEQQYPELKEVQDSLDPDEIVTANDIELVYGQEFEVEVDLSGIDGVDESKIKIMFHEAKNESGADFDTHTPDTYKAVYAVEPVSGHPSYRISRNITVKEPETEMQSESSSEITVDDDSGTGDTEQSDDDSESHRENTVDTKTELTVSEVLEQAETNGIDLYAMDAGETVTFMASAGNVRSSQQVSVTRGTMYRYADYGYGSYLTYQYTVKFGNVSATAYCVQPSKPGPGSGTYTINKVGDGKALAKVCYYGTKASGSLFVERRGARRLSKRYVQPPCRVVSFSSQQQGVSLADELARTLHCDAAGAQDVYDRWLSRTREGDVLTIEGVGVLKFKNFTLAPAFDRLLNPQGHEPVR